MKARTVLLALSLGLGVAAAPAVAPKETFRLKDSCPPSFTKDATGGCKLVTLYQMYSSPEGFGGLRNPLPTPRDGFDPKEIDLGRFLFFDPILSKNKDMSCATCHDPKHGFADGLPRGVGAGGVGDGPDRKGPPLRRATPSLWNVAFLKNFFWDMRSHTLEEQATGPMFAADEMGNDPGALSAALNASPEYRTLFAEAYKRKASDPITVEEVERALAAFQSTLVSLNSRYDRYAHGDQDALTEQEKNGHNIFRSFVARCTQCHSPPLFTTGEFAVTGGPEPEGVPFDPGMEPVFDAPELRGAFKIPSLRNISKTAPYNHSGAFKTLEDVVNFYNAGRGAMAPKGEKLFIHWHIADPKLRPDEVQDVVAFLKTLDDETMMPEIPTRVPSGLPVRQLSAHSEKLNTGEQR